jgi:hypothetical protein
MADAKRIAGVRSFAVSRDGAPTVRFSVAGSATIQASQVERETLTGATGPAGYSESPIAGFIEVEVFDRGDISLADMSEWSDVTATLVTGSGKVYAIAGWLTDAPELSATDGTMTIRIEVRVEEVAL